MSTQATQPALLEARPSRVFCPRGTHVLAEVGVAIKDETIHCRGCMRETKELRRREVRARVGAIRSGLTVHGAVASAARALMEERRLAAKIPVGRHDEPYGRAELATWKRSTIDGHAWLARPASGAWLVALFDREALERHDRKSQAGRGRR